MVGADDFTELPMTLAHTTRLQQLALHHSDPFDRMLVAQAQTEGLTRVSYDKAFKDYGVALFPG